VHVSNKIAVNQKRIGLITSIKYTMIYIYATAWIEIKACWVQDYYFIISLKIFDLVLFLVYLAEIKHFEFKH